MSSYFILPLATLEGSSKTKPDQFHRLVQDEVEKAKGHQTRICKCLSWTREPMVDYKDIK